jgi:hypothetical protein
MPWTAYGAAPEVPVMAVGGFGTLSAAEPPTTQAVARRGRLQPTSKT